MPLIRNPAMQPELVLGTTVATMNAAKAALQVFFQANANQQFVDEAAARATHPLFASDRIWAQVKADLGLSV